MLILFDSSICKQKRQPERIHYPGSTLDGLLNDVWHRDPDCTGRQLLPLRVDSCPGSSWAGSCEKFDIFCGELLIRVCLGIPSTGPDNECFLPSRQCSNGRSSTSASLHSQRYRQLNIHQKSLRKAAHLKQAQASYSSQTFFRWDWDSGNLFQWLWYPYFLKSSRAQSSYSILAVSRWQVGNQFLRNGSMFRSYQSLMNTSWVSAGEYCWFPPESYRKILRDYVL